MKKTLIIFFVTLLFSSSGFSNEKINNIYDYMKKVGVNNISIESYIKIGEDFYFIIDIFKDYSLKCDWALSVYDSKGWENKSCITYRKKVLPSLQKIRFIGDFMNEGDLRKMTLEQKRKAFLFPIKFDQDLNKILEPKKKYEVIK